MSERSDDDAALLMRQARLTMPAAVEASTTKSRMTFHPDMRNRAGCRLNTEAGIRAALRNDAFSPASQSIVDLRASHLTGAEALLRCGPPELDGLYTNEIIAIAERSSPIAHVDRWVIDRALTQMDL